jgi:hypothetical protein
MNFDKLKQQDISFTEWHLVRDITITVHTLEGENYVNNKGRPN